MEDVRVFENAKERAELFKFLSELPIEYHKEYKRFRSEKTETKTETKTKNEITSASYIQHSETKTYAKT
jgi:hypothetical protein